MDAPELRSALRTAEQRRDEVMSFLSHDMRSPLSSMLALLELHALDPDAHPAVAVHERIEQLARGALELNELFGRVAAAETKPLAREALDPADLCAVAMDAAWEFASGRNIGIDLVPGSTPVSVPVSAPGSAPATAQPGPALVWGDHELLMQAVVNLILVMARNSANGSRLKLGWAVDHENVSIDVAGPGEGFAAADTMASMTPPPPSLRGDPGSGAKLVPPKVVAARLELALVNLVVERHGGRLAFDQRPGSAARFTLALPLHRA